MFEIIDKEVGGTIIKVVGVGGAGGNAPPEAEGIAPGADHIGHQAPRWRA